MARCFCESSTILPWSNTLATWCEELTHWKRPWCWERLKGGEEGDDRGWDGISDSMDMHLNKLQELVMRSLVCFSPWLNPCRGRWQVPIYRWHLFHTIPHTLLSGNHSFVLCIYECAFFFSLFVCYVFRIPIKVDITVFVFCVWLVLLNMMTSSPSMFLQIATFHFFHNRAKVLCVCVSVCAFVFIHDNRH